MHDRPGKSQNSPLSPVASTSNPLQSRPFEAQAEVTTPSQQSAHQSQPGEGEPVKSSGFNLANISIFDPGATPPEPPKQPLIQLKLGGQPALNGMPETMNPVSETHREDVKQRKSSGFNLADISIFAPGEVPPALPRRPLIQCKAVGARTMVDLTPSDSGNPLPEAVQQKMESSLGADFSNVRVHEGPQAKAIGALAFTQGNHLHFAPGQYNPNSSQGQELLGHELTHVVQQRAGRVEVPQGKDIPINADPSLEAEADRLGAKAAEGKPAHVEGVSRGVQRKSTEVVQCFRIPGRPDSYDRPIESFAEFRKIVTNEKITPQRLQYLTEYLIKNEEGQDQQEIDRLIDILTEANTKRNQAVLEKPQVDKSKKKVEPLPQEDESSLVESSLEEAENDTPVKSKTSLEAPEEPVEKSDAELTKADVQGMIHRARNLLATGRTKVENYQRFAALQARSYQYVSKTFPERFWAGFKVNVLDKAADDLQNSYQSLLDAHREFILYENLVLSELADEQDAELQFPRLYKVASTEYKIALKLLQDLRANLTTEYQTAEEIVTADKETVLEASPLKRISTWGTELQKLVDSKGEFDSASDVSDVEPIGSGAEKLDKGVKKSSRLKSLEQTLAEKDMTAAAAAEGLLFLLSTDEGGKSEFDRALRLMVRPDITTVEDLYPKLAGNKEHITLRNAIELTFGDLLSEPMSIYLVDVLENAGKPSPSSRVALSLGLLQQRWQRWVADEDEVIRLAELAPPKDWVELWAKYQPAFKKLSTYGYRRLKATMGYRSKFAEIQDVADSLKATKDLKEAIEKGEKGDDLEKEKAKDLKGTLKSSATQKEERGLMSDWQRGVLSPEALEKSDNILRQKDLQLAHIIETFSKGSSKYIGRLQINFTVNIKDLADQVLAWAKAVAKEEKKFFDEQPVIRKYILGQDYTFLVKSAEGKTVDEIKITAPEVSAFQAALDERKFKIGWNDGDREYFRVLVLGGTGTQPARWSIADAFKVQATGYFTTLKDELSEVDSSDKSSQAEERARIARGYVERWVVRLDSKEEEQAKLKGIAAAAYAEVFDQEVLFEADKADASAKPKAVPKDKAETDFEGFNASHIRKVLAARFDRLKGNAGIRGARIALEQKYLEVKIAKFAPLDRQKTLTIAAEEYEKVFPGEGSFLEGIDTSNSTLATFDQEAFQTKVETHFAELAKLSASQKANLLKLAQTYAREQVAKVPAVQRDIALAATIAAYKKTNNDAELFDSTEDELKNLASETPEVTIAELETIIAGLKKPEAELIAALASLIRQAKIKDVTFARNRRAEVVKLILKQADRLRIDFLNAFLTGGERIDDKIDAEKAKSLYEKAGMRIQRVLYGVGMEPKHVAEILGRLRYGSDVSHTYIQLRRYIGKEDFERDKIVQLFLRLSFKELEIAKDDTNMLRIFHKRLGAESKEWKVIEKTLSINSEAFKAEIDKPDKDAPKDKGVSEDAVEKPSGYTAYYATSDASKKSRNEQEARFDKGDTKPNSKVWAARFSSLIEYTDDASKMVTFAIDVWQAGAVYNLNPEASIHTREVMKYKADTKDAFLKLVYQALEPTARDKFTKKTTLGEKLRRGEPIDPVQSAIETAQRGLGNTRVTSPLAPKVKADQDAGSASFERLSGKVLLEEWTNIQQLQPMLNERKSMEKDLLDLAANSKTDPEALKAKKEEFNQKDLEVRKKFVPQVRADRLDQLKATYTNPANYIKVASRLLNHLSSAVEFDNAFVTALLDRGARAEDLMTLTETYKYIAAQETEKMTDRGIQWSAFTVLGQERREASAILMGATRHLESARDSGKGVAELGEDKGYFYDTLFDDLGDRTSAFEKAARRYRKNIIKVLRLLITAALVPFGGVGPVILGLTFLAEELLLKAIEIAMDPNQWHGATIVGGMSLAALRGAATSGMFAGLAGFKIILESAIGTAIGVNPNLEVAYPFQKFFEEEGAKQFGSDLIVNMVQRSVREVGKESIKFMTTAIAKGKTQAMQDLKDPANWVLPLEVTLIAVHRSLLADIRSWLGDRLSDMDKSIGIEPTSSGHKHTSNTDDNAFDAQGDLNKLYGSVEPGSEAYWSRVAGIRQKGITRAFNKEVLRAPIKAAMDQLEKTVENRARYKPIRETFDVKRTTPRSQQTVDDQRAEQVRLLPHIETLNQQKQGLKKIRLDLKTYKITLNKSLVALEKQYKEKHKEKPSELEKITNAYDACQLTLDEEGIQVIDKVITKIEAEIDRIVEEATKPFSERTMDYEGSRELMSDCAQVGATVASLPGRIEVTMALTGFEDAAADLGKRHPKDDRQDPPPPSPGISGKSGSDQGSDSTPKSLAKDPVDPVKSKSPKPSSAKGSQAIGSQLTPNSRSVIAAIRDDLAKMRRDGGCWGDDAAIKIVLDAYAAQTTAQTYLEHVEGDHFNVYIDGEPVQVPSDGDCAFAAAALLVSALVGKQHRVTAQTARILVASHISDKQIQDMAEQQLAEAFRAYEVGDEPKGVGDALKALVKEALAKSKRDGLEDTAIGVDKQKSKTRLPQLPSSLEEATPPSRSSASLQATVINPEVFKFLGTMSPEWNKDVQANTKSKMIVSSGQGVMLGSASKSKDVVPVSGEIRLTEGLQILRNNGKGARCFIYSIVMGLTGRPQANVEGVVDQIAINANVGGGWIASDSALAHAVIGEVERIFGVSIQVIELQNSVSGPIISGRSHNVSGSVRRPIVIRNTGAHYDAII